MYGKLLCVKSADDKLPWHITFLPTHLSCKKTGEISTIMHTARQAMLPKGV